MVARLTEAIRKIRDYTEEHDELRSATLFSFDVKLGTFEGSPSVVVFGINQAEYDCDRALRSRTGHVLEDTSEGIFRDAADLLALCSKRKADRWYRKVKRYVGTEHAVLGERFFWSSIDTRHLELIYPRYAEHLEFCQERNDELLQHYSPRAVVLLGTSDRERMFSLYRLKRTRKALQSTTGRTVIHFGERDKRPWFIVLHPSAWPRRVETDLVRNEVRRALGS